MDRGTLVGPVAIHSGETIEYANDAFCDLVGVESPAAITGRSLGAFIADSYRGQLGDHFDALLRGDGAVYGLVLELERDDGTRLDAVAVSSLTEWNGDTWIHTSVMDLGGAAGQIEQVPRESAAHQSPIGVTIADADAGDMPLVYVNDAFVDLTGYPREETIGRNCRFLQGPETREERVAEIRAAIEEERPGTVELRNYRKDGSLFWNRLTVSPVRDSTGTVTHFLGFQQDVSAAKLSDREKALFETHAEMSEQVMYIADIEGTIQYVNPAFERITGYTAAEAVGRPTSILRSGTQDDAFYERMWETVAAGEVWEATLTNRTKSGELYRCKQKVVPITDDRGEVTHAAAIEPDITDEQLTHQALDVLNRILRHNVRTSVNVIDGYADLLESGIDESERRAAIRAIRERAAALKEISDRTTDLRRLFDANAAPSPLSISGIERLVDGYRDRYEDAVVDLTIEAPRERVIRNGDVFRIALDEVVENAIVHADRTPPHVEITVRDSESERMIDVTVADDGPGIPDPEWEIIKTGSETPLHHTNSIGLWLIYWSVTAFGGSIDLASNEPRGSVLTLRVPVETGSPRTSTGSRETGE